jgi:hypothetical protein
VCSGFPSLQRGGINAQLLGHPPLRQAECAARSYEEFSKRVGWWKRVVAQKPYDGRDVTDSRNGCVAFPVGNRQCVNANPFANVLLKEPEVEAASADMVA